MPEPTNTTAPRPTGPMPLLPVFLLVTFVYACSIYANLSFAVTNPQQYRYFPPFRAGQNLNMNNHLGAEYFNIARSLAAGRGFADPFGIPFGIPTGPTAWMPPVLPVLEAGLLKACGGNVDAVMAVVVFLQVNVLIATGLLVLALARRTGQTLGTAAALAVFCAALLCHFHLCFQFTHDCWLVLLAMDLVVAGLCWFRPLRGWVAAAAWGLLGGFCVLVNPIVGLAWGAGSVLTGVRQRAWARLAVAAVVAGLVMAPWTIRNYRVFGRLIPVKANAAYELYQSQCLQSDGLLQGTAFAVHPYGSPGRERKEYRDLGESAFLDKKRAQFWEAVRRDPADFLDRAAERFLGATLWYVPFDRVNEPRQRPYTFWFTRVTHPLPFLAALVLLFTAPWRRLDPAQWVVLGVYVVYLLPYVAVSYYDRYSMPLIGVKALLVVWAADRLLSLWVKEPEPAGATTQAEPAPRAARGRAVPA